MYSKWPMPGTVKAVLGRSVGRIRICQNPDLRSSMLKILMPHRLFSATSVRLIGNRFAIVTRFRPRKSVAKRSCPFAFLTRMIGALKGEELG